MNRYMNRNEVFLDAMGLGPQWRLRNAPAVDVTDAEVGHDDAAGVPDIGPAVQLAAPQAQGAMPEAAVAHAAAQDGAHAPVHDDGVGPVSAASPAGSAAAAAPAQPAARAMPSSGEDTSWFDDAPDVPSTRPALKSQPTAKAPPPARPAGHAPAGPSTDAGGESYAWFDDVPATPIARPVRKPAPERDQEDGDDTAPRRTAPRQAAPAQSPRPAAPAQAMPDDGMPWFDDAPLPSFDAAFDDLYDQPGMEEAGVSAAAITRMDWPALRAAVQSCTRCTLCQERTAAVPGRGADRAPWLVLATAPHGDDEAQGRPLAAAPGQLLDNMLKAIEVAPEREAYVTTLVKCRPRGDRAPTADEVAACRPYLERELALAGSRAIVTLGHTAAKGLLGAAARGKVLRLEQIPVVATYHPADLLRKPEDKAKAWADLCLARAAFDGRA